MILQKKTLEKLRILINEETEYRSGPSLVDFFNRFGFQDSYGKGFPSRWTYTDEKLEKINGTLDIDKCIKIIFSPINFVNNPSKLKELIIDFNKYLAFDGWNIVMNNGEVSFKKALLTGFDFEDKPTTEDDFLNREFQEVSLQKLKLNNDFVLSIMDTRLDEIKKCISSKSPMATIFLCGSVLEGILLGIASNNPHLFNKATSSPKNKETGKVLTFEKWTLSDFINTAKELDFIHEDVRNFSHVLRDFRNYIHPFHQSATRFSPTEHTAKLCWQTLKAAIYQISQKQL